MSGKKVGKKWEKKWELGSSELSQNELKILDLIVSKNLSPSELISRLKISKSNLYRNLAKLRQKGWLEKSVGKTAMPITINNGKIRYFRYHKLHYKVVPYYFYKKYGNVEKGHGVRYGIWTLTFNKTNIEFQLRKKEAFVSYKQDVDMAIEELIDLAQEGLEKAIKGAGEKYGFEVLKEGKVNIFLLDRHLAEVNNGIAKIVEGKQIKVRGNDGKVWLEIDKSTGVPEFEFTHPELCLNDAHIIGKYHNDFRDNKPPTNTDLLKRIEELKEVIVPPPLKDKEWLLANIHSVSEGIKNKRSHEALSFDERWELAEHYLKDASFEWDKIGKMIGVDK